MRVMVWSARRCRKAALLAAVVVFGILLLRFPAAAATGVKRGLGICGQLLIPSLFPFMVLSGFVIRGGIAQDIGRYLAGVMEKLFGFSGCAAVAVLISMVGGYPAGSTAVTQLYDSGAVDKKQAQRLLCCCVNAGPAFIIGGIGAGMLGSAKAGLLLLVAHWTASVILMCGKRQHVTPVSTTPTPVSLGTAVNESIHTACHSLIAMGGFVLAACTVVSLTDAMGGAAFGASPIRIVFTCLLEVSTGCMEAATTGVLMPFIVGAALGFGGLSVHGQIAAVTAERGLMTKAFFACRLLHALLGGCLSFLLFHVVDPELGTVEAMTALSSVTGGNDAVSAIGLLTMMLLCVLFLTSTSHGSLCAKRA